MVHKNASKVLRRLPSLQPCFSKFREVWFGTWRVSLHLEKLLVYYFDPRKLSTASVFRNEEFNGRTLGLFLWKTWPLFPDWQGSYVMYGKQNKPNFFLRHLWQSESWPGRIGWNSNANKNNDDLKEKAIETEIFVRVFQENDGFIFISKTDRRLTMGHMATWGHV